VQAGAWGNLDLCEMPRTAIVSYTVGAGTPARSPRSAVSDASALPSFDEFVQQEERKAAEAARRPRR
jgi:hypothetical protein